MAMMLSASSCSATWTRPTPPTASRARSQTSSPRASSVTYDMKPSRDDPTAVGTSEVADAIIEKLG